MIMLEYDPETDVLYVKLAETEPGAAHQTRELDAQRLIDLDEAGEPIGIELLHVSAGVSLDGLPEAEAIREAIRKLSTLAPVA